MGESRGGKDGGAARDAAALLIVARSAGVRHRRGLQGMGSQGYRHSWVRESQALSGLDKLFPEGPVLGASRTLAMLVRRDARLAVLILEPCFPASHSVIDGREDERRGFTRRRGRRKGPHVPPCKDHVRFDFHRQSRRRTKR